MAAPNRPGTGTSPAKGTAKAPPKSPAKGSSRPPGKGDAIVTASVRRVSMLALSQLLARDRTVLYDWVDKGCPYVQKGNKDLGHEWVFDVAEVVRWRERRVVEEAIEDATTDNADGSGPKDPEARMKLGLVALKFLREQRAVILVDDVTALWGRAFGLLRQSVMALPVKVARLVPGLSDVAVQDLAAKIRDNCADALDESAGEIERAVRAARKVRDELKGDGLDDGDGAA